jgi:hypothetical protein
MNRFHRPWSFHLRAHERGGVGLRESENDGRVVAIPSTREKDFFSGVYVFRTLVHPPLGFNI